jgi:hypothetical protein
MSRRFMSKASHILGKQQWAITCSPKCISGMAAIDPWRTLVQPMPIDSTATKIQPLSMCNLYRLKCSVTEVADRFGAVTRGWLLPKARLGR